MNVNWKRVGVLTAATCAGMWLAWAYFAGMPDGRWYCQKCHQIRNEAMDERCMQCAAHKVYNDGTQGKP